jgi:hypothetical protein
MIGDLQCLFSREARNANAKSTCVKDEDLIVTVQICAYQAWIQSAGLAAPTSPILPRIQWTDQSQFAEIHPRILGRNATDIASIHICFYDA